MRNLLSRIPTTKKLGLLAAAVLVTAAMAGAPHPAQGACHNWDGVLHLLLRRLPYDGGRLVRVRLLLRQLLRGAEDGLLQPLDLARLSLIRKEISGIRRSRT